MHVYSEASPLVFGEMLHCCGLVVFATSHHIMDGKADSLVMTVHLLAKSGHALLLQQTLDQLQEWICLDLRLFLVSERTSPMKYYETYRQKSSRFPGTSVLLFLHEDFGEERIFRVHGFFQHPPWQRVHIESAKKGQLSPCALDHQDFYGLDEHMPVWGLRQVHYGTEILRVTLYCSFDNYDDAVRLYEMILQREAAVQKSSFCAFVLYATQSIAVQLCLKQLPLGVCVDSKESSVLQFKVHEIGQLVPLLPNPCVPISSTRWQTEDYEGNKILLQVQGSAKHSGNQGSSSSWHNNAWEDSFPLSHSNPTLLATTRTAVQQKTRTLRAMKNKNKSTRGVTHTLGSPCSPSQSNVCFSSQSYSRAGSSLQDLGPSQVFKGLAKWTSSIPGTVLFIYGSWLQNQLALWGQKHSVIAYCQKKYRISTETVRFSLGNIRSKPWKGGGGGGILYMTLNTNSLLGRYLSALLLK